MRYSVDKLTGIDLGRQGENLARTVEIDVSAMLAQWPDATISLLVKRKHDADPYVAKTEVREGVLYWPITSADTASAGDGKLELRAVCGEVLAKSATGSTRVTASLTGSETEPPAASQGWVDQVLEAGAGARASAEEAKTAAVQAQSVVETLSALNAKAVTTAAGTQASVEVKDGVIIYSIPRGDTGPRGPQGEQGIQGVQGEPGYTPVKGVDYFDGEDGYTPVKGKDYWTAEDQETIDAAREGEERRSAAEDARAQAEQDRAAAEQSRATAEEQRQTNWQTLRSDVEQRISDAATAAQNASKAETAANGAAEKANTAAQRADDAVSGIEDRFTTSEKALLDKVCPVFEETGHIVQCHPVEESPLSVQTRIDALQHFDWAHRIAETAQVTTTGKNLLDSSTEEVHGYNIWAKNPFTEAGVYTIQAFASGSYTWCCYVSDANGDSVQRLRSYLTGDHPTTVTIEEEAVSAPYILIGPSKNPGGYSLSGWQMMVEKGDTASTAYEPYTGGKAAPSPEYPQALVDSIPAGNYYVFSSKPGEYWKIQLEEALGGVPQYADAIEVDRYTGKYRIIRRTGQIALDGSEDERWTIGGKYLEDQSDWYYSIPVTDSANVSDGRLMCSHYPYGVVANNGTTQGASILGSCLRIRWGSEQSVDAFRPQLAASPITVRYQLQTESVIIGQAERVKSVSGLTALNATDMALTQPDLDHPCAITGWDNAEMVRCGRNLLDLSVAVSYGAYGFTTELHEDGLVRIFGTYAGTNTNASFAFMDVGVAEYDKLCRLGVKYKAIGDTEHIRNVRYAGNNITRLAIDMGGLVQGEVYDVTFGVMAYTGDIPSKFEPYSGASWTTTLPETVYGGRYDWTAGKLEVDYAHFVLPIDEISNGTLPGWRGKGAKRIKNNVDMRIADGKNNLFEGMYINTKGNNDVIYIYCSRTGFENGEAIRAAHPGAICHLVAKIESPEIYHLTPQHILAIPGINTLYSSTGDTIVAGRTSPIYLTQSILDRLAALEGAAIAE